MTRELLTIFVLWIFICFQVLPQVEASSAYNDIACPKGFYHDDVGFACCPCSNCPSFGEVSKYVSKECRELALKGVIRNHNKICVSYSKQGCQDYYYTLNMHPPKTTTTTRAPPIPRNASAQSVIALATEAMPKTEENDILYLILGGVFSGFLVVVLVLLLSFWCYINKKKAKKKLKQDLNGHPVQVTAVPDPNGSNNNNNSRKDGIEETEKDNFLNGEKSKRDYSFPIPESEPDWKNHEKELDVVFTSGLYEKAHPTMANPPPSYHSFSTRPSPRPQPGPAVNINPVINGAEGCTIVIAQTLENPVIHPPPHQFQPPSIHRADYPTYPQPTTTSEGSVYTTPSIFTPTDFGGSERCPSVTSRRGENLPPSVAEHDVGMRPVHLMRNDHPSSLDDFSKSRHASLASSGANDRDRPSLASRAFSNMRSETEAKDCTYADAVSRASLAHRPGPPPDLHTQISSDSDVPELLLPPRQSSVGSEDLYSASEKYDTP